VMSETSASASRYLMSGLIRVLGSEQSKRSRD
jgi:hypothetical protein